MPPGAPASGLPPPSSGPSDSRSPIRRSARKTVSDTENFADLCLDSDLPEPLGEEAEQAGPGVPRRIDSERGAGVVEGRVRGPRVDVVVGGNAELPDRPCPGRGRIGDAEA